MKQRDAMYLRKSKGEVYIGRIEGEVGRAKWNNYILIKSNKDT